MLIWRTYGRGQQRELEFYNSKQKLFFFLGASVGAGAYVERNVSSGEQNTHAKKITYRLVLALIVFDITHKLVEAFVDIQLCLCRSLHILLGQTLTDFNQQCISPRGTCSSAFWRDFHLPLLKRIDWTPNRPCYRQAQKEWSPHPLLAGCARGKWQPDNQWENLITINGGIASTSSNEFFRVTA